MSYLALARKWRPRRFEDVRGQPHVVQALSHALAADRLHPAILLTGTRGVGKTTLARIIAKGLNCETGVTASPCGSCAACRQLDEGRYVDLLEIDAASHTGVDNVRDLIDNAQYAPSQGRYKVYLVDEVHMLSKQAFNALLKTLEEPPPHVKFLLATTDPQKLPVTVLSRCLQFNLKRLPAATIRELLEQVLKDEGRDAEPGAMAELARAADGSMRDGLSLLDQALLHAGGKKLARAAVEEMLGTQGRHLLLEIVRAVSRGDAPALFAHVAQLDAHAPDYAALLNDLAALLQRIAILRAVPEASVEDEDGDLAALAETIPAEDVQLYYQIAVNGRRDLAWAPEPRLGFEMTLLRMVAFRPAEGGAPAPGAAGGGARAPRAAPPRAPAGTAAPEANEAWAQRVEALGLEGFTRQLARHCEWAEARDGAVRLRLDPRMKHLLQEDRRAAIEAALARAQGSAVRLTIEVAGAQARSPAHLDEQRDAERRQAARAAIEADPNVRALREQFGATVRTDSIRPLDNGGGK